MRVVKGLLCAAAIRNLVSVSACPNFTASQTPVGRMYPYSRIDQVRTILKRADCASDQWSKFEEGLRCWGLVRAIWIFQRNNMPS